MKHALFQIHHCTVDFQYLYEFSFNSQVIDGCAFRVYGHWVKKGEEQNRAALFENSEKTELYYLYLMNLGGR